MRGNGRAAVFVGSGVAHRSCRVKAGAARHRAMRGCGLDPARPLGAGPVRWPARCAGQCVRRSSCYHCIASIFAPPLCGVLSATYGIAVAFRLGALAWIFTVIGYLLSRETSGVELERIDQQVALGTAPPGQHAAAAGVGMTEGTL